jgi:hypothetical protein
MFETVEACRDAGLDEWSNRHGLVAEDDGQVRKVPPQPEPVTVRVEHVVADGEAEIAWFGACPRGHSHQHTRLDERFRDSIDGRAGARNVHDPLGLWRFVVDEERIDSGEQVLDDSFI